MKQKLRSKICHTDSNIKTKQAQLQAVVDRLGRLNSIGVMIDLYCVTKDTIVSKVITMMRGKSPRC